MRILFYYWALRGEVLLVCLPVHNFIKLRRIKLFGFSWLSGEIKRSLCFATYFHPQSCVNEVSAKMKMEIIVEQRRLVEIYEKEVAVIYVIFNIIFSFYFISSSSLVMWVLWIRKSAIIAYQSFMNAALTCVCVIFFFFCKHHTGHEREKLWKRREEKKKHNSYFLFWL